MFCGSGAYIPFFYYLRILNTITFKYQRYFLLPTKHLQVISMESMKRGLYVAGAIGLGALLGAGCVPVDPAEPMKDELPMYKVGDKEFKDYMDGFKDFKGPVKGIKEIEDYIKSPEKTGPRWWCMWYCYYPPRTP